MVADAYPWSLLQEGLVTLSMKQPVLRRIFSSFLRIVDPYRFKAVWQKTVQDVDILRTRIVHMKSSAFLQVVIENEASLWHTASSLEEAQAGQARIPEFPNTMEHHSPDTPLPLTGNLMISTLYGLSITHFTTGGVCPWF
jgi:hypothetical protein